MPENKGEHLTIEDRQVIEDGIRDGLGVLADGADGSHVLLQQRFPSVQVAAVNLVALLPQLLQPAEGGLHYLGGHPAAQPFPSP